MNRGIARRTLFETRRDCRKFLACVAWQVRARRIEVHAFCLMPNHFHLLLRSPEGAISSVMQCIQNDYARWFNRIRRRDGPLYRSRFASKPVLNDEYCFNLVRYIDFNPVQARLAAAPALYPHGSARCYARSTGPRWLTRDWVEDCVRRHTGLEAYDPARYSAVFGEPVSVGLTRLVESRLHFSREHADPLDDLLKAANPEVIQWMRRKALLADGTTAGIPVCEQDLVSNLVDVLRQTDGAWTDPCSQREIDAWPQVHAALLRDLCGATRVEISIRTRQSERSVGRALTRHRRSLTGNDAYAARLSQLVRTLLQLCHRGEKRLPPGFALARYRRV